MNFTVFVLMIVGIMALFNYEYVINGSLFIGGLAIAISVIIAVLGFVGKITRELNKFTRRVAISLAIIMFIYIGYKILESYPLILLVPVLPWVIGAVFIVLDFITIVFTIVLDFLSKKEETLKQKDETLFILTLLWFIGVVLTALDSITLVLNFFRKKGQNLRKKDKKLRKKDKNLRRKDRNLWKSGVNLRVREENLWAMKEKCNASKKSVTVLLPLLIITYIGYRILIPYSLYTSSEDAYRISLKRMYETVPENERVDFRNNLSATLASWSSKDLHILSFEKLQMHDLHQILTQKARASEQNMYDAYHTHYTDAVPRMESPIPTGRLGMGGVSNRLRELFAENRKRQCMLIVDGLTVSEINLRGGELYKKKIANGEPELISYGEPELDGSSRAGYQSSLKRMYATIPEREREVFRKNLRAVLITWHPYKSRKIADLARSNTISPSVSGQWELPMFLTGILSEHRILSTKAWRNEQDMFNAYHTHYSALAIDNRVKCMLAFDGLTVSEINLRGGELNRVQAERGMKMLKAFKESMQKRREQQQRDKIW